MPMHAPDLRPLIVGAPAAVRCCMLAWCTLACVALGCGGCFGEVRPADPPPPPTWTSNVATRLEALALLESLNAELLSHDSATLTLERWCAAHQLASPPLIVAQRSAGAEQPPTDEQRAELKVAADELVRYRHVRLTCGAKVL